MTPNTHQAQEVADPRAKWNPRRTDFGDGVETSVRGRPRRSVCEHRNRARSRKVKGRAVMGGHVAFGRPGRTDILYCLFKIGLLHAFNAREEQSQHVYSRKTNMLRAGGTTPIAAWGMGKGGVDVVLAGENEQRL